MELEGAATELAMEGEERVGRTVGQVIGGVMVMVVVMVAAMGEVDMVMVAVMEEEEELRRS